MRSLALAALSSVVVSTVRPDAPWPCVHGDVSLTGFSPGVGPPVPLQPPSWKLSLVSGEIPTPTDVAARSPVFSSDGGVFAIDYTSGAVVRARVSDGSVVWAVGVSAPSIGGITLDAGGAVLFVATQTETSFAVFALDAATGNTLWSSNFPTTDNDYVSNTPAISGPRVFVKVTDGTVRALNASTGAEIWSVNIGDSNDAQPIATSTVALGDCSTDASGDVECATAFVATTDDSAGAGGPAVIALVAATGARRWTTVLADESLEPTTELVVAGSRLVWGCARGVAAYAANNGTHLWARSPSGNVEAGVVSGAPAYSPALNLIFVSQLFSGYFALSLETGLNVWFAPNPVSIVGAVVDAAGTLYAVNVDSVIGAFSAVNGTLLSDIAMIATAFSSPALDGAGRIALIGSSTLFLFGGDPPVVPSGGAVTSAPRPVSPVLIAGISIASAFAALLSAGSVFVCVSQRRKLAAAAVMPQRSRSFGTSMDAADGDDSWGRSGNMTPSSVEFAATSRAPLLERAAAGTVQQHPRLLGEAAPYGINTRAATTAGAAVVTESSFYDANVLYDAGRGSENLPQREPWPTGGALDGDSWVLGN